MDKQTPGADVPQNVDQESDEVPARSTLAAIQDGVAAGQSASVEHGAAQLKVPEMPHMVAPSVRL
jgi:hypothetical protein